MPGRLLRIAHRGASGHCPENTRAAFLRAIELGADMIELDCQLTRDGAVVVIHDETLERTTTGRGPVRAASLREIKALDAGAWFSPEFAGEEILTLEETIEILRDKISLNLEMKGDDEPGRLELRCLGIVSSRHFLDETVFSSFSSTRTRALRELSSRARIGVLMDAGASWSEAYALAEDLGAEALHLERSLASPRPVEEAHRRGLEVRAWPINEQKDIEAVIAAGVDGIFTDYPERLLRYREDAGSRKNF